MSDRPRKLRNAIRTHWPFLLGVLVLALLARRLYFGANQPILYYDSGAYLAAAKARWLLSASRTPGYPAWLRLHLWLFGPHALAWVALDQKLLGVFSNLLLYLIFWRLTRNRWIAAIGAVVPAFHFQIIAFEARILSEGLTMFLTTALAGWLIVGWRRACTFPGVAVTGLLTAVLILVKPSFTLAWAPVCLCMAVPLRRCLHQRWRIIVAKTAVVVALNAVALFGWSAVMWRHYGIRGMTNLTGINLAHVILKRGLLPDVPAGYDPLKKALAPLAEHFDYIGGHTKDIQRLVPDFNPNTNQLLVDMALDTIRAVPLKYTWLALASLPRSMGENYPTFTVDKVCRATGRLRKAMIFIEADYFRFVNEAAWVLFALLLVPILIVKRRSPLRLSGWGLIFLLVAYLVLVDCFIMYDEFGRHRKPIDPLKIGALHAGLCYLWSNYWHAQDLKLRRRRLRARQDSATRDA